MGRVFKVTERRERVSQHNGQRFALLTAATPAFVRVPDPEDPSETIKAMVEPRIGRIIGFEASNAPHNRGGSDHAWVLQKGANVAGDVECRWKRTWTTTAT
jgi:hypothetical protein